MCKLAYVSITFLSPLTDLTTATKYNNEFFYTFKCNLTMVSEQILCKKYFALFFH